MNPPLKPDTRVCLTIFQPWAWLIIRPDLTDPEARAKWEASPLRKGIENRKHPIAYRGRLYIHAGKTIDVEAVAGLKSAGYELPDTFDTCGLIGHVDLIGTTRASLSPWFSGPVGWEIEKPVIVPFEPMRGYQGLWRAGDAAADQPPPGYTIQTKRAGTGFFGDVKFGGKSLPLQNPPLKGWPTRADARRFLCQTARQHAQTNV